MLVIAGLAYAGGGGRSARRYRPGRPFDFTPVWFLSAPEQLGRPRRRERAGAGSRRRRRGRWPTAADGGRDRHARGAGQGTTGGASDRW